MPSLLLEKGQAVVALKTAVTESVVWKKSLRDVRGAKARQRVRAPGKRWRQWSRKLCARVYMGKSARLTQIRRPSNASSDFLDALTQENGCGLLCGCQGTGRLRTSC